MIADLISEMCACDAGDIKRIQHFMKVYAFAKAIGTLEGLNSEELLTLEAAAVLHDIGIKKSIEKYGSDAGEYQQKEGPPLAKEILERLGFSPAVADRVCYLIAHHHDYGSIDNSDYQILVEADLLVNFAEGHLDPYGGLKERVFKTKAGNVFYDDMFTAN